MERRVWRAIAVLVALVTVVTGGSGAWAALVQQTTVIDGRPYQASISQLVLDTGSASVEVEPGPADQISVRQVLSWTLRRPTVAMTWDRDVLHVAADCFRLLDFKVLGLTEPGCTTRLEIRVPAGTKVTGRSTSGETQLRRMTGEVHLQTNSGAIQLVGLTGPVWAAAKSGQVTGTELTSREVQVTTSSGQADLAFGAAPARVTMHSSSGELNLTVPAGSRYDISGRTSSGSRSIDPEIADTASPNKIDIVTSSGSATVAWPSADAPPSAPISG